MKEPLGFPIQVMVFFGVCLWQLIAIALADWLF